MVERLTPENKESADLYLAGNPMYKVGQLQGGLDKSTISKRLSRPEVRKYIEKIQEQFLTDNAEIAAKNIKEVIGKYLTASDMQDKEHGYKASMRVLESIGVLPSPTQSIVYNQINQSTNIISPAITMLLKQHSMDLKSLVSGVEEVGNETSAQHEEENTTE